MWFPVSLEVPAFLYYGLLLFIGYYLPAVTILFLKTVKHYTTLSCICPTFGYSGQTVTKVMVCHKFSCHNIQMSVCDVLTWLYSLHKESDTTEHAHTQESVELASPLPEKVSQELSDN